MLYDAAGNRTSLPASVSGSTLASWTTSYTYNSTDELTQEASARNGSYTNNFGYEAAFNPTTFKGTTHTFNSNNQDTAWTYDRNGNPTSYRGYTLTYNPENRLTAYGSLLTAGYRGDGLRAWKQNSSGTRTYYLYDGADPVCELDSSGNLIATNTFGPTGLLSRNTTASVNVFYSFDTQGSVCQRTDRSGNVLSTGAFDAFGSVLTTSTGEPLSAPGCRLSHCSTVRAFWLPARQYPLLG